jgi:hypothetical protein
MLLKSIWGKIPVCVDNYLFQEYLIHIDVDEKRLKLEIIWIKVGKIKTRDIIT